MKNNYKTELKFTETYKKYKNSHPAIREAMCLQVQFPAMFKEMKEGDLFAGRIEAPLIGFSPDEWGTTAFGYYCLSGRIEDELKTSKFSNDEKSTILDMLEFWKEENTSSKLRNVYPPIMAQYLSSDNWMDESGVAFPLYRLTGGNVNFKKLVKLGIPGLIAEISKYRNHAKENNEDLQLYDAMLIAMDIFKKVLVDYRIKARQKAVNTTGNLSEEWLEIARVLSCNIVRAPKTFREAIQLFWIYSLIGDIRNYGRMDDYLGNFLVDDLNSGKLTETGALNLLKSLWKLIADRNTVVHGRIIIGGRGRENEKAADKFALLALEATRQVHEIEPQLSLRFYEGMNPKLMEKSLDVIGEGRTYPILYNDDVNIPSIQKAFQFNEQESEQYVPFGCGEYILEHQSFGTPSGVINLLKVLEVTLHNGYDPISGKLLGLQLGEFTDFNIFDELWNAYQKQAEHFVKLLADQEILEYKIAGESAAYLFQSILYDDCLKRNESIFSGGIRYLGGTLETYGNSNTADSLTAIKELVYEKKLFSQKDLLEALDANFKGYNEIRKSLLKAPKFGNDDKTADSMLMEVHNHICNFTRKQARRVGLHSYLVVIINNSANTLMGKWTGASADGRFSGKSMNNGNAPTSGMDREGITALLNSLVKPDTNIHAGAVQNLKFNRDMFGIHRNKLNVLLKTYFQNGGAQAMITVVNRSELEKALETPEEYSHIFVRVGGFSARFVELSHEVQLDILNRTLY